MGSKNKKMRQVRESLAILQMDFAIPQMNFMALQESVYLMMERLPSTGDTDSAGAIDLSAGDSSADSFGFDPEPMDDEATNLKGSSNPDGQVSACGHVHPWSRKS